MWLSLSLVFLGFKDPITSDCYPTQYHFVVRSAVFCKRGQTEVQGENIFDVFFAFPARNK